MISKKYKFIFIHIPKTAGESMEDSFSRLEGGYAWNFHDTHAEEAKKIKDVFFPIRGSQLARTIEANPHFKLITFVRNPWDRLASLYLHSLAIRKREGLKIVSFSDYILVAEECYKNRENHNFSHPNITGFDTFHLRFKQVEYIPHLNKKYLESNVDGTLYPNIFVGRFENLQDDFHNIQQELNLPALTLPNHKHHNEKRVPYKEMYNEKDKSRIEKFYEEDICEFKYIF